MYIAQRMTAFLIRRGIITEDKKMAEIYEYGFELILGDLVNFAIVLLISGVLQGIGTGLLYLFCFVSVRIFSGGFHAKTHFRCGLAMVVFYLMFAALCRGLSFVGMETILIGTALAYVPVICCSPVVNENRPLGEREQRRNKKRAVILYTLWAALAAAFVLFGTEAGKIIFSTLWVISFNIVFARIVQFMERSERHGKVH